MPLWRIPASSLQPSAISLRRDPACAHQVGIHLHILHRNFRSHVHFKRHKRGTSSSWISDREIERSKCWESNIILSEMSVHEGTVIVFSCQRLGTRIHKYLVKFLLLFFFFFFSKHIQQTTFLRLLLYNNYSTKATTNLDSRNRQHAACARATTCTRWLYKRQLLCWSHTICSRYDEIQRSPRIWLGGFWSKPTHRHILR